MNSFPLVRQRWSNEHIMAALFIVLLLYMLPGWTADPSGIAGFLPVLVLGLAIDAVAGIIRYKRPVCSVSAGVTACILQLLTPGVPLWGRLIGITAALLAGKHIWGGTGKNPLNPALTGVLLLALFFRIEPVFAIPTLFYIPAMLLSLSFLFFRPSAGLGLTVGMALALLAGGEERIWAVAVTCVFYGCIIATDPVTVTHRPVAGLIGGLAAGMAPLLITHSVSFLAAGILIFNLASYLLDQRARVPRERRSGNFLGIGSIVPASGVDGQLLDLAGGREGEAGNTVMPDPGEIFERIEKHGVYGMGGAGFPASVKLGTLMESGAAGKYLVINAVECDPGLVHDKWILKNHEERLEKGIYALCSYAGFKKAYVAVKDPSGLSFGNGISVVRMPDLYPVGAEKILIEKVLGIKLPEKSIPAREGILVLNVQTVLAIYDAVYLDKDADTRYITVSDLRKGRSRVARVRLGSGIHETLEKAFGGSNLVFAGGGAMQAHMASDGDAVDRTVNYIASASLPHFKESPQCSRCGFCRSACPVGLESGRIADLVDAGKVSEAAVLAADRCLGCGSCSYVCLAGRNLAARVTEAKRYSEVG